MTVDVHGPAAIFRHRAIGIVALESAQNQARRLAPAFGNAPVEIGGSITVGIVRTLSLSRSLTVLPANRELLVHRCSGAAGSTN
jgi:hypothetical protein